MEEDLTTFSHDNVLNESADSSDTSQENAVDKKEKQRDTIADNSVSVSSECEIVQQKRKRGSPVIDTSYPEYESRSIDSDSSGSESNISRQNSGGRPNPRFLRKSSRKKRKQNTLVTGSDNIDRPTPLSEGRIFKAVVVDDCRRSKSASNKEDLYGSVGPSTRDDNSSGIAERNTRVTRAFKAIVINDCGGRKSSTEEELDTSQTRVHNDDSSFTDEPRTTRATYRSKAFTEGGIRNSSSTYVGSGDDHSSRERWKVDRRGSELGDSPSSGMEPTIKTNRKRDQSSIDDTNRVEEANIRFRKLMKSSIDELPLVIPVVRLDRMDVTKTSNVDNLEDRKKTKSTSRVQDYSDSLESKSNCRRSYCDAGSRQINLHKRKEDYEHNNASSAMCANTTLPVVCIKRLVLEDHLLQSGCRVAVKSYSKSPSANRDCRENAWKMRVRLTPKSKTKSKGGQRK